MAEKGLDHKDTFVIWSTTKYFYFKFDSGIESINILSRKIGVLIHRVYLHCFSMENYLIDLFFIMLTQNFISPPPGYCFSFDENDSTFHSSFMNAIPLTFRLILHSSKLHFIVPFTTFSICLLFRCTLAITLYLVTLKYFWEFWIVCHIGHSVHRKLQLLP